MKDLFNIESPFMQLLTRVGDLIIVNVLYLLCCVPIVTIGAATAALHKVGQAIVYDTDNGIAKTFFRAFRDNFKQATALWLMMVVFAAAMGCNYLLISGFGSAECNLYYYMKNVNMNCQYFASFLLFSG